jgi:GGDEF domain-containing protein
VGIGFIRVGHPMMSQHGEPDLIASVGRAVRSAVRASDTVAYLGRGLFALILNDASSTLGARSAAARIIRHLEGELGHPQDRWSVAMGFVVSMPSHQRQPILMAQAQAAFTRATNRSRPGHSTIEEAVQLAMYDPEYDGVDGSDEDDGYPRAS